MTHANLNVLHEEWQKAVRAHETFVRNGRSNGLTFVELDELARLYLFRVDSAYERFRRAEAEQAMQTRLSGIPLFKEMPKTAH